VIKYSYWKEVWADIVAEFSNLDQPLKEAFSQRQTKQIRTEDMLIEINVAGTKDDSLVNIQVSGGSQALKLRNIMDNLGYIQTAQGKYSEALSSLNKALDIDPDYEMASQAKEDLEFVLKWKS